MALRARRIHPGRSDAFAHVLSRAIWTDNAQRQSEVLAMGCNARHRRD